jgi:hypothetical protein
LGSLAVFTSSCSDLSAISIVEPQSEVSLRFAIVPTGEVPPRALGFTPSWGAFVAAATLRGYLDEMDGDGFLALLAYIIGPRAGCGGTGVSFPSTRMVTMRCIS